MVKCRECGIEVKKEDAYLVLHGKSNWYYCQKHGEKLKKQESCLRALKKALNQESLSSEFDEVICPLFNIFDTDKIKHYIFENEEMFRWIGNKTFSSDKHMGLYVKKVLSNNIPNYKDTFKEEVVKEVQPDIVEMKYKHIPRKGLLNFFEEEGL